jgi:homeobox protein cut-like
MIEESDQRVIELWTAFDLSSRKVGLDKQLIELRESKTSAVDRRKRLNEETKRFRALSKEDQASGVTEILKSYQSEIDLLTRRSKLGESAFVNLYKMLYELPDPAIAMESLAKQVKSAASNNLEITRLQGELRQYEEEFRLLKNQDIKIRHLEEELKKFRDNIEARVQESVEVCTADVELRAEERIFEALEQVKLSDRRASEALETARVAQAALNRSQTQLLQLSASADRAQSDLMAENALLVEGNSRLLSKLAELDGQMTAGRDISESGSSAQEERGLRANGERQLRDSVAELQIQLQLRDDALRAERIKRDDVAEEMGRLVVGLRGELLQLTSELSARPTREELQAARHEVRVLQKMMYHIEDDEGDSSLAHSLSPLTDDSEAPNRAVE